MAILLEYHGNSLGVLWECSGNTVGGKHGEYSGSAMGCGNSMWEYARSIIRILPLWELIAWECSRNGMGRAWENQRNSIGII